MIFQKTHLVPKLDTQRSIGMNFLRLIPVFISFLLLGAHFLRAGNIAVVVILLAFVFLLFVKKYWVPWVIQLILLLGSLEWVRTLVSVAQVRIGADMPWTRMAVILGAVALFTAFSCLVFRSKALRERYSGE
jgi:hypothetical protein